MKKKLIRFVGFGTGRFRQLSATHPVIFSYVVAVLRKSGIYYVIRPVYMRLILHQYEVYGPWFYRKKKQLPPRSRQIYSQLEEAIHRHKKESD